MFALQSLRMKLFMNNKSNKSEKVQISSAVKSQVVLAFVILIIILAGTIISVAADVALSNSASGSATSMQQDKTDSDNENQNNITNETEETKQEDFSKITINSIADLTADNHRLTRRDNLNEYGKKIYDGLYQAALNRSEFEFMDGLAYSEERSAVLTNVFTDMLSGFVLMDHPEIFWCHGSIKTQAVPNGDKANYSISMIYDCDESKINQYDKEIKDKLSEIVKQIPKGSQYEQALWVHDYLVNNTVYNLNPSWAVGKNENFGGSVYGLLIKNESVCNGYAKTFKYLMDKLNIPCTVISGVCNDGELHAWNILELDGDYYQVDVTWDDPVGGEQVLMHDYFCITDSEIYESRKPDSFVSAPQCNSDKY